MNLTVRYILLFAAALGLSTILIAVIIRLCEKFSIFDRTGGRKIHTEQVGRLGGVGIVFSFIAVTAVWILPVYESSVYLAPLFASLMIVFFMGLYDDVEGINAKIKLPLQIAAAGLAVYSGVHIGFTELITGGAFHYEYVDSILTVIWILSFMNAMNLIDGMDGLSSGMVIIALMFFTAVGFHAGNTLFISTSLILLGSVTGFYIFNFPPAKIFMGDAGAYSVGFILAVMMPAAFSSMTDSRMISVPAVIFLVPFLDVGQVIIRRLWLKHAIFIADNNHIHHKLLASGYTTNEVLKFLYPIASIFGCIGVLYWDNGNRLSIYLLLLTVVTAVFILYWISDKEKRMEKLQGIIEPGFRWWEHHTRYHPEGVQSDIIKYNGRKITMQGNMHEIYAGGFFYATPEKVSIGDEISMTLLLGARRPLNLKAEIVHVSNGDSGYPAGFECMFLNAGYIAQRRIKYHLLSVKAEVRRKDEVNKILEQQKPDKPQNVLKIFTGRK